MQYSYILSKIWLGLLSLTLVSLLWLSVPYIGSAYYLDRGVRLLEDDRQSAIHYLDTALRLEPDNILAYRQFAKVYLQTDKPDQALAAAQQALRLAPHNPVVQLELGDVYDRLGEHEQAIAHFEAGSVGDRQPQLIANYLQLAERLWTNGDQIEAISIWQKKVLESSYGNLYANWRLAQYYVDRNETVEVYRQELQNFSLEHIAFVPPDPRLDRYQTEAFADLVAEGIWPWESLLDVIAYRTGHDQSPTTEHLLKSLISINSGNTDLYFYLGEMYYRRGDLEQARSTYQQIIDIDPQYAIAYLRLGMINEVSGGSLENTTALNSAIKSYNRYLKLVPDDLLALKKLAGVLKKAETISKESKAATEAAKSRASWLKQVVAQGPAVIVNQELENGWKFLGYRTDESHLIRGRPTSLWLYWQGPVGATAGDETNGWYPLGEGHWVQVVETATNLVFNGGFELGLTEGLPAGFPANLYGADSTTRQLTTQDRTGEQSTVAVLKTTEVYSRTSLVSRSIPINSNALYLETGWILTEGGRGYIGYRWTDKPFRHLRAYGYVAPGVRPSSWQHYAGILEPVSDANGVQIRVLNNKAPGRVYFDNIMLIEVGRPGG